MLEGLHCLIILIILVILCVDRMMSDYKVEMVNDGMNEFYVEFHGPRESMWSSFQVCIASTIVCAFILKEHELFRQRRVMASSISSYLK
jgi:ABC-type spermidine/putrescine transport system permease subunit I